MRLLCTTLVALAFPWPATTGVDDRLETAVQRLSAQIKNKFEEQSRFDLYEKGFIKHLEGALSSQVVDAESSIPGIRDRLQTFLDAKIKALRSIVSSAEDVASGYVYTQKWVHDAVVSKFRASPLPGQDPTKFERECAAYIKRMAEVEAYRTPSNDDPTRSALHVTVESFKCDNAVLRDFEWTGNQTVEDVFAKNQAEDPSIARQYLATYTGVTRMLPAIKWKVEPYKVTMDLFDPRFRPWFIGAESAPKDIIFLLDYSGSVKGQTAHLTKILIKYILMTLTSHDFFTAVWYNSRYAYVMAGCSDDRFLPATSRNKRLFQTMLDKIEERDVASLPGALNFTFERFSDDFVPAGDSGQVVKDVLEGDSPSSNGHKLVFLFTDGIENWPIDVLKNYSDTHINDIIRVFGFSMGYGTGEMPPLEYVSCETKANYVIVDSIMDVRHHSRDYLSKLSEVLALSYADKDVPTRPVTWTPPYMDAQEAGAVIALSMPVLNTMYNATPGFLGVAGVDVTFAQLREILPTSDHFYAFLIDSNGFVHFHPRLKLPKREAYAVRRTACYNVRVLHRSGTRVPYGLADERVLKMLGLLDSIAITDIAEIERETPALLEFRRNMIDGICEKPIADGPRVYHCTKLVDTPLVLGFVHDSSKIVLSAPPAMTSAKPSPEDFEGSDLVAYFVDDHAYCVDQLSAHSHTERLNALVFGNLTTDTCLAEKDRVLPHAFIKSAQLWQQSWPALEENATCLSNPMPFSLDSKHFIAAFVHFFQGITAFYPKCSESQIRYFANNPARTKSLQQRLTADELVIEHEPLSNTILLTKPLIDSHYNVRIASVGVQWSTTFLHDSFINITLVDPGWASCMRNGRRCLVVNDQVFVVASTVGEAGRHLSEIDPLLLRKLIEDKAVSSETEIDYQAECEMERRALYSFTASAPAALGSLRRLIASAIESALSLFAIDLAFLVSGVFSRPVFVDGNCKFETPENTEQCAMQYTRYQLHHVDQKEFIHLGRSTNRTSCSGTLTIVPFRGVGLYLFALDPGDCLSTSPLQRLTAMGESNLTYKPFKLDDCTLTAPRYRRRRRDLDLTREHPDETVRACTTQMSNAAAGRSDRVPHRLLATIVFISWLLTGI